jgi:predicted GIY-YIG superfamily endonuclease
MLLRDRLLARLSEMGPAPDHQRLAAEVLGIRNASPDLARRLVAQALVVEDRRDRWRLIGERIASQAPAAPGVYVLRDAHGRALYVGKATNLRRRLGAHFADRQWRRLKPDFARATDAEWQEVGSEIEALLREAALIRDLAPLVNVQVSEPDAGTRAIPAALRRDVLLVVPSIEPDSAELIGARADGGSVIQRTRRSGADVAVHTSRLFRFFHSPLRRRFEGPALAPIVFSWLAGRGSAVSRIDPHDLASARELRARLAALLADDDLFSGRIVVLDSKFRLPRRSAQSAKAGRRLSARP